MRLMLAATITTPKRYERSAWSSTMRRIGERRSVVSETWYVMPIVNATYAKSRKFGSSSPSPKSKR